MHTRHWLLSITLLLAAPLAVAEETTPIPVALPDHGHAAQPRLHAGHGDRLWLSWVERVAEGRHRLQVSDLDDAGAWTPPRTVAEGDDWFVNWADFPAVASSDDGGLWAHWLRKVDQAPYAYEIRAARSEDGGTTWSPALTVHDDGTPTEHGFASLVAIEGGGLLMAWLDGRETVGHGDGHGAGAMTLRAAILDGPQPHTRVEWPLDARTCDCCQTAAVRTDRGPVVAYRGRTDDEIRDIMLTRLQDDRWTTPIVVNDDRWLMPACPVNGPAAAADGSHLWVAWYTVAAGLPTIRVAGSADAGETFAAVRDVDAGLQVLGRVGTAVSNDALWLVWLVEDDPHQSLRLARLPRALDGPGQTIEVAQVQGRGRATGVPQIAVHRGQVWVVWTDVVDGRPSLRAVRLAG